MGVSGRAMIEALIAGERDPQVLAGLARGRMKVKHAALVQALTGRFGDHHGELARMLLDSYDALTAQIGTLTSRIEELIAAIPEARGVDAGGATGPGAGEGPDAAVRSAIARLDQIPGVGRHTAQVILAETGLDRSSGSAAVTVGGRSWQGGSSSERRRSCRSRSPSEVMFTLRSAGRGAVEHGPDQGSVGPVIAGHRCRQRRGYRRVQVCGIILDAVVAAWLCAAPASAKTAPRSAPPAAPASWPACAIW